MTRGENSLARDRFVRDRTEVLPLRFPQGGWAPSAPRPTATPTTAPVSCLRPGDGDFTLSPVFPLGDWSNSLLNTLAPANPSLKHTFAPWCLRWGLGVAGGTPRLRGGRSSQNQISHSPSCACLWTRWEDVNWAFWKEGWTSDQLNVCLKNSLIFSCGSSTENVVKQYEKYFPSAAVTLTVF